MTPETAIWWLGETIIGLAGTFALYAIVSDVLRHWPEIVAAFKERNGE